ncbi:MAG: deoxynucleoside kinase [Bacteroidales bacterium]
MNYNYIAIEGNIGSGKTSLAKMIAKEYNAKLILERFADNSFLPKFYENPRQYAFPLEMSFLADRYQQLREQVSSPDLFKSFTIADYFINKSLIFARKTLQTDEYSLYSRLFNIINSSLPQPELIIYLYATVEKVKQNIINRGREYEQSIQHSYLEKIQDGYFDHFKINKRSAILIVDTNNIDFVENKKDYLKISKLIHNKYPVGIHRINLG